MQSRFVVALVAAGALFQIHLAAHHSFAAEFDQNKPVTLTGKLTKMEWTNPHGWIFVDVIGPDGKVVNWAIESGSPNALIRRGLRPADFTLGTTVVVATHDVGLIKASAGAKLIRLENGSVMDPDWSSKKMKHVGLLRLISSAYGMVAPRLVKGARLCSDTSAVDRTCAALMFCATRIFVR